MFDGFSEPEHKSYLGDDPSAFGSIHYAPALLRGQRNRLFGEDMYTQFCRNVNLVRMSIGRQTDDDDIQWNLLEHLRVVCKHRCLPVCIFLREGCCFLDGAIAEGD